MQSSPTSPLYLLETMTFHKTSWETKELKAPVSQVAIHHAYIYWVTKNTARLSELAGTTMDRNTVRAAKKNNGLKATAENRYRKVSSRRRSCRKESNIGSTSYDAG